MFLDAEGRTLMEYSGPRTPGGFEKGLVEVQAFLALDQKAQAGDPKAAVEVLIRQLQLGWYGLEEASKRAEALEAVSGKQQKELDQLLVDIEVRERTAAAGSDRAKRREAGEHFFGMWKAKRVPATEAERYGFWTLMADYAEGQGDKKLFKQIIAEFDDAFPNTVGKRKAVEELEKRLGKL